MSDGQVTRNQGDEAKIIQEMNLRSYSQCINCPTCGKIGYTKSESQCNALNLIFAICLGQCWFCHQILKKKDLNCYDAEHRCVSCNTVVANYTAC